MICCVCDRGEMEDRVELLVTELFSPIQRRQILRDEIAAVSGEIFEISGDGEGGKKVRCRTGIIGQEPEYLSDPPHSAVAAIGDRGGRDQRSRLQPKKLLRKKKNESWAMRLTGQTSPTL